MKGAYPYLISAMLVLFSCQVVGHYSFMKLGVPDGQIETPFEEESNKEEKEKETEEKEIEYTVLRSLDNSVHALVNNSRILHEDLSGYLFWLENDTPPPRG